jgi:hypothetical protein
MAASNSYRIRRTSIGPYGPYVCQRVVETIAMTLRPVAFQSLEILAGGLAMILVPENGQWPEGWGSWGRSMVLKSRSSCPCVCIEDAGYKEHSLTTLTFHLGESHMLFSHGRDRWE